MEKLTLEMFPAVKPAPKSAAERMAAYRSRQREAGKPDVTRQYSDAYKAHRKDDIRAARRNDRAKKASRPFVACDGEGCGVDAKGRQLYMLFRMGHSRELFTGKPLETERILDFICGDDGQSILVGFAFGYDVTMILRDLPERQQRRLFEPKSFEPGRSNYIWYKDFDIDYLPKQYFRVKRIKVAHYIDAEGNRRERREPIKGSQRTIWETFGFFQKSFLKCLESFDVGLPAQRESIALNKARRGEFEIIDQTERDYCALECDLLSDMMDKLRDHCRAAGIIPKTWSGAGKLASALHLLNETPKAKYIREIVPQEVQDLANMAYYGGRFEITRVGDIKEKVYEYDICSAYPAAMQDLPCLCHGRWEVAVGKALSNHKGLYVASASFSTDSNDVQTSVGQLGGLPIRSREGHLYWPARGAGIYWSPEIQSAQRLGVKVKLKHGYVYHKECTCTSFDWVERLYEYRKSIGSQGPGYPIKLGINSLYGKLAQRKGNGVYHNMVWAGLITAYTRAKINDAIALAPNRIIMVATDAVYSLDPLPLVIGDKLGQWETHTLNGLFIVQPGLYWCPEKRKRKSRGLSGNFFERPGVTESFEQAFHYYRAESTAGMENRFPSVQVDVPGFIGLKLALARNKPETAGRWILDTRSINFDYGNKRQSHIWRDGHIVTSIKPGSPGLVSLPHRDFLKAGGQEPWEMARSMLEEQPDYIELGPPFED